MIYDKHGTPLGEALLMWRFEPLFLPVPAIGPARPAVTRIKAAGYPKEKPVSRRLANGRFRTETRFIWRGVSRAVRLAANSKYGDMRAIRAVKGVGRPPQTFTTSAREAA